MAPNLPNPHQVHIPEEHIWQTIKKNNMDNTSFIMVPQQIGALDKLTYTMEDFTNAPPLHTTVHRVCFQITPWCKCSHVYIEIRSWIFTGK